MARINVFAVDEYDGTRTLAGWFDPDRARAIEGRREWDGNDLADVHVGANRWQTLYRTAGGRWVLETSSAWQHEETTYQFITDEQARQWLLVNGSDDVVEEYFGEIEEERGPGRPEIGPVTTIRLGEELTARVDAARRDGESRAAAIRRLLEAALGAQEVAR
ncbi:CopG family transcriptional regulator [uncultured Thermomonospora sp.]|uniref:ribbon-helix-helix domain-containing protein n=1 Tax=uncultured Thermomonospora sp. TaxID=671175 RepID=UPI00259B9D57|nr:CopG family transcriptional regulator [uncultured Thermomonospora sp.]